MEIRDNALESMAICLRLGYVEDAKIHGELSKKMAARIKNHRYGDKVGNTTSKEV